MDRNIELAWAAGFIDGEGCFSVKIERDGKRNFRLSVSQADRRPLDRLETLVPPRRGKVQGPYITKNKPIYQWSLTGVLAEAMYRQIQPYMSGPKSEQAEMMLELVRGD